MRLGQKSLAYSALLLAAASLGGCGSSDFDGAAAPPAGAAGANYRGSAGGASPGGRVAATPPTAGARARQNELPSEGGSEATAGSAANPIDVGGTAAQTDHDVPDGTAPVGGSSGTGGIGGAGAAIASGGSESGGWGNPTGGAAGGGAGAGGAAEVTGAGGTGGAEARTDTGGVGIVSDGGTGGAGGVGLGGGTGGALPSGGATSDRECTSDADCSDDVECNGIEVCDDGECVAGAPIPCEDPSEHCVVECIPERGGCITTAADKDGDGDGSALCAENPGGDCDDTRRQVHSSAEEVCDGIDNDCDGLVDLEDGLSLGTMQVFPGVEEADVAWSSAYGRFELAMSDGEYVFAQGLTANGSLGSHLDFTVNAADRTDSPRVASTGPDRVYAYSRFQDGERDIVVHDEPDAGFPATYTRPANLSDGLDSLVALDYGTWLVALGGERPSIEWVVAGTGFVSGVLLPETGRVQSTALAAAGSEVSVVWEADQTISWALYTTLAANLELLSKVKLADVGEAPAIAAAGEHRYALAWVTPEGASFELRRSSGAVACRTTHIEFGDGLLDGREGIALAATDDGVAMFATDEASDEAVLLRLSTSCQIEARVTVAEANHAPNHPHLAAGDGTIVLTWTRTRTTGKLQSSDSYALATSELFCR